MVAWPFPVKVEAAGINFRAVDLQYCTLFAVVAPSQTLRVTRFVSRIPRRRSASKLLDLGSDAFVVTRYLLSFDQIPNSIGGVAMPYVP